MVKYVIQKFDFFRQKSKLEDGNVAELNLNKKYCSS